MKKKEFNKLLKEKTPKEIINMYTTLKIYLTDRQLDYVINLKNKKKEM